MSSTCSAGQFATIPHFVCLVRPVIWAPGPFPSCRVTCRDFSKLTGTIVMWSRNPITWCNGLCATQWNYLKTWCMSSAHGNWLLCEKVWLLCEHDVHAHGDRWEWFANQLCVTIYAAVLLAVLPNISERLLWSGDSHWPLLFSLLIAYPFLPHWSFVLLLCFPTTNALPPFPVIHAPQNDFRATSLLSNYSSAVSTIHNFGQWGKFHNARSVPLYVKTWDPQALENHYQSTLPAKPHGLERTVNNFKMKRQKANN